MIQSLLFHNISNAKSIVIIQSVSMRKIQFIIIYPLNAKLMPEKLNLSFEKT